MNTKKMNKGKLILSLLTFCFLVLLGMTIYISLHNIIDAPIIYFETFPLILPGLFGGVVAIVNIKKRKLTKSTIGISVICFGIGLIAWSVAGFVWAFYNFFFHIDVPFPSLADAAYILTPAFWFIGILFLQRITGTKYQLRTIWGKTVLILVPLFVVLCTFYLVFYSFYDGVFIANGKNLQLILTIYYPISDVLLLAPTLVILVLSWKTLGGTLKRPLLLILTSFIFMYVADMGFAYTTLNNTYHNGSWPDVFYGITMLLLAFGINSISLPSFDPKNILYPLECEDIFSQLALKIIKEEEKLIGSKAWELAMNVPGIFVDVDHILKISGNKNETINKLISQYEQVFGNASRELARDAIKNLSTIANTVAIDIMITLNISSVIFFIRHISTGNFYSIFPFNQTKFDIDRHHPVVYYLLSHKGLIANTSVPQLVEEAHTIAEAHDLKEISEELRKYQAEITGGIYSDDELIGLLMIGQKSNGEKTSQKDVAYIDNLLKSCSRELAVIIHYRDTQASVLRMKPA